MIPRKMEQRLQQFYNTNEKKALLLTGARQVGKTFIVREFGKHFSSFVEINFLENKDARDLFKNSKDSSDMLMRLSLLTEKKLIH